MTDNLHFIYCAILSFSGFTIGFYGIMAKHRIELETKIGMNKGYNFDTDKGNAYFAERYENWKVGSYFDSQIAPLCGIVIALIGTGLNLINNSWWTSILLLIIAYLVYLVAIKIFNWKIQIVSILTLILSVIMIITNLV
jgi:hypothetical protein